LLQRYSKLPCLEEIEGEERVGIAFDNMVVRPDNLHAISNMYPALKRWAVGSTYGYRYFSESITVFRIHDIVVWIRILLFSSLTFKTRKKN
jgi:hypothetical protein